MAVPVILLRFHLDEENFQLVSPLWKEVSDNRMGGDFGFVSLGPWSIACCNCLGGHGGPTVLWWGEGSILPLPRSRSRSRRSQSVPGWHSLLAGRLRASPSGHCYSENRGLTEEEGALKTEASGRKNAQAACAQPGATVSCPLPPPPTPSPGSSLPCCLGNRHSDHWVSLFFDQIKRISS